MWLQWAIVCEDITRGFQLGSIKQNTKQTYTKVANVNRATGWMLGGELDSQQGLGIFSLHHRVQTDTGSHAASYPIVILEALSLG
jgi:hypothetical protein